MSSPFDRAMTGEVDGALGQDWAVSPQAGDEERVVESALRPHSLREFIGQPKVARQLDLVLEGAKRRGRPPDHVLLSGPPGLGKTSLALIIGSELGTAVKITSGPAIERSGDLAAMLSNLGHGDVLFIDEIHRIARPAEELLYMAMEDFRVDVVVGKGPGATAIPLDINPFTLVGATTRAGLLTGPLRDRFGFVGQMEFYEPADLELVLAPQRRAARAWSSPTDGSAEIAGRSRGTPRIANRLLRRVRDYAEVEADGRVTREVAQAALALYDVDVLGLDRLDRAVLEALVVRFGGGPVGRVHAGGGRRRGAEHRRGGLRALPRPGRAAGPHPARAGRDRGRLAAPGPSAAAGRIVCLGGAAGELRWGGRGRCRRVRRRERRTGDPGCVVRAPVRRIDSDPLARNSSGRCRARPARSPERVPQPTFPSGPVPARTPPRRSARGREAHLSWIFSRSSCSPCSRSCCSCSPPGSASGCRPRRRHSRSR